MLNEILEYEKRLLEDREQLRKLVENSKENSAIEQDKLNFFKAELAYMNKQLEMLSRSQVQPTANIVQQPVQIMQQPIQQPVQHMVPPYQQPMYQKVPQMSPVQPVYQNRSEDFEKKFGKTFMGIVASVLIFISIILFATLLIPSLNNTIKMVVTYVVSFAICGFGWFKLHRNRQDKFYIALTGCGIGALYISLLLSNMYFKVIGDIALYALIVVWAVGVCLLSRYNNIVFQIIGWIGVVISMIFGVALCGSTDDISKFTVLIIFYLVTSTVLYATHFRKNFNDNICAHVANVISLFVILIGSMDIAPDGHFTFIIIIAYIVAHIVVCFLCTWKEQELGQGLVVDAYGLIAVINVGGLVDNGDIWAIVAYMMMVALIVASEFRYNGKDSSRVAVQIFGTVVSCISVFSTYELSRYGIVPMLILPLIILGYARRNKVCKIMGLCITYIYVTDIGISYAIEHFILGLVVMAVLYTLVFLCRNQYNKVYKSFVHVAGVLLFAFVGSGVLENFIADDQTIAAIIFLAVALFNVGIMKSPWAKNPITGEEEKDDVFNVINIIMMLVGLNCMHSYLPIVLKIMVIMATLGIFMVNSKKLLDKYPNGFGGAYVGIKFTIYMLVLLSSFDATDYVVSISCFLFAVASIAFGFIFKYKALRVYGLVLYMISVFKLIVMDIEYADTIGYAVSFFVAGVLCFAISLIYNYVDKKLKATEVPPQVNTSPWNNMMR